VYDITFNAPYRHVCVKAPLKPNNCPTILLSVGSTVLQSLFHGLSPGVLQQHGISVPLDCFRRLLSHDGSFLVIIVCFFQFICANGICR